MKFPLFSEYYNTIKIIEKCLDENDGTIDNFFDLIESKDLNLETVMTSDIAQMTVPLGAMRRKHPAEVYEVSPDNPKAEEFILKNKSQFKRRYGDKWEEILYATAWRIAKNHEFSQSHINKDK